MSLKEGMGFHITFSRLGYIYSAFLLFLFALRIHIFAFYFFVYFQFISALPFLPLLLILTKYGLKYLAVSSFTSIVSRKYLKKNSTFVKNSLLISKLVLTIQKSQTTIIKENSRLERVLSYRVALPSVC